MTTGLAVDFRGDVPGMHPGLLTNWVCVLQREASVQAIAQAKRGQNGLVH